MSEREKLVEAMAEAASRSTSENAWDTFDDIYRDECRAEMRAALAALEAAGVRLAPVEATADQREAGMAWIEADSAVYASDGAAKAYRAMLAASPYAKEKPE